MQTVSASASTPNQWVRIASRPREAKTEMAPKLSGISGRDRRAEDEQEDDQQDRQRDQLGRARRRRSTRPGSPSRSSRSRSGWRSPARGFSLRACVRGRGPSRRPPRRCRRGSRRGSARGAGPGEGGRRRRGPTGESVVTCGFSRRRVRIRSGPWRSIAAAGPRSRIGKSAVGPKCSSQHPVGPRGRGAGDVDRARAEPVVEPGAEGEEHGDDQRGDGERPARVPQRQRRREPRPRDRPARHRSAPCSSSQARSVVWRASRRSGRKDPEDSVKKIGGLPSSRGR